MALVCGVGINDADYMPQRKELVGGKQKLVWMCPYYRSWRGILERCYLASFQRRNPTYIGCTVAEEWYRFSTFKAWMETQDWEGKQLDKDLLVRGNKVYSPDTCLFVDKLVNTFVIDCAAANTGLPLGVYLQPREGGRFVAQCSNPFTKKRGYVGTFDTPEEASRAWLSRKIEFAHMLADQQTDQRVANALRNYYVFD